LSLIGRIHHTVQKKLTEGNEADNPLSTPELQRESFPGAYQPDSRIQRDAVYGSITRGRDNALIGWEKYAGDPQFLKDLSEIEYYANGLIDEQERSGDYAEFFGELYAGRFADKTDLIKGNLRAFALIAVLWDRKLKELSQMGMNLVISNYGKNSKWRIPSFWKWAIRETNLYIRSLKIVQKQIERGITTKVGKLPGVLPRKAIGYTESAKAALTDGTSWKCECEMINIGTANFCSNCGKSKEDNKYD